jgi:hypothetical protein
MCFKKHDVPVSTIPCLAYQKRKETIERQIREHQLTKASKPTEVADNLAAKDTGQCSGEPIPMQDKQNQKYVVSIQSNEEKSKENFLGMEKKPIDYSFSCTFRLLIAPDKIHEYCKRLFEFDIIKVKKFK